MRIGGVTGPQGYEDPSGANDVQRYKRWFEEAQEINEQARREAETDRDYHDGKQWTPEEKRILEARGQPVQTYNLVRVAINGMVGVVERSQSDPKAYGRNAADEQAADIATQALRFVADEQKFDRIKAKAAREYFVEGLCAVAIEVERDNVDFGVRLKRIPFYEFFYDPFSREDDLSDGRYMGRAKWVDADMVKRMFPDREEDIEAAVSGDNFVDDTYADKPWKGWVDQKRRRLLLVEMYHKELDGWRQCIFVAATALVQGPSPYLDAMGQPMCPIEAVCFARDRDGFPYGAVRDLRSPQDGYNKRHSKLLHLLNVRQTFGSRAAVGEGGVDEIKRQMARPDGHIEITHGTWGQDFGVIPTTDMASGQFQLMQEARLQMDRLLPNPGILGRDQEGSSGRAQLVQQSAGLTELADAYGGLVDWELRIYRQIWQRCRQYWTGPRWVRTSDDLGASRYLQINEPIVDAIGMPQIDPQTGQPATQNRVAELDVDIILDVLPEAPTQRHEQFMQLAQMAGNGLPIPPEILIEHSQLRDKAKLIQAIQQQRQAQMQAQAGNMQVERQRRQAEARKTLAQAQQMEIETGMMVGEAGGQAPVLPVGAGAPGTNMQ